jgi:hypothetical protein
MKPRMAISLTAAVFALSACAEIGLGTSTTVAEPGRKSAATASASGYGAIAFSETSQRWRFRWNVLDEERATELALDDCGDSGCRIILKFGPKQCGTFALGNKNVTAAAVGKTRDQAERLARERCDATTEGCRIAPAQCNA